MPDVCILTLGVVASFLGWFFNLIATGAPAWRAVGSIPGVSLGTIIHQGLWDICIEVPGGGLTCQQKDAQYFAEEVVTAARGLMITSVVLTGLAQILTVLGFRCWRRTPDFLLAGLGGVAVFCGGVFSLIPLAWYTSQLKVMGSSGTDLHADYCIVLGFIGSSFQLIGGLCLMACFYNFCRMRRNAG